MSLSVTSNKYNINNIDELSRILDTKTTAKQASDASCPSTANGVDIPFGATPVNYRAKQNGTIFCAVRSKGGANCFLNNLGSTCAGAFMECRGYDTATYMTLSYRLNAGERGSLNYHNIDEGNPDWRCKFYPDNGEV